MAADAKSYTKSSVLKRVFTQIQKAKQSKSGASITRKSNKKRTTRSAAPVRGAERQQLKEPINSDPDPDRQGRHVENMGPLISPSGALSEPAHFTG